MADGTWISDEPRLPTVLRWVLARSLHHRRLVVLVALLAATASVALRVQKNPTYEATLYFRLTEGGIPEADGGLRPPRDIRQHIASVALARKELEAIMKKYHLSTAWLARDREGAVEDFRSSIEIFIERNYFIYDRTPGEGPRTAQVTISLSGAEEEQTRAVLHEIGDAILRDQAAQRASRLEQAGEVVRAQTARARARTRSLQEAIARLSAEAAGAGERAAIPIRARIAVLQAEAKSAFEGELATERRASAVAFSAASDEEQLGMHFELIDERVATFAPPPRAAEVVLWGVVVFAAAVLVTAILVGAFDDRIYGPQDVTARGLPLLGALPRFPGDDAGSYRARMAQGRV